MAIKRTIHQDAAETLDVRVQNDENSGRFERFRGKDRVGWSDFRSCSVCLPSRKLVGGLCEPPFLKAFEGGVIRPCSIQLAMQ